MANIELLAFQVKFCVQALQALQVYYEMKFSEIQLKVNFEINS
jgi:hypothetical protein